jgi:hypothetical protein
MKMGQDQQAGQPVPPEGRQAERVILVSMMKSGTHLITELMAALGYRMYGHVRVRPETKPVLDRDSRWRVAEMVYDAEKLAALKTQPESAFNAATDQAWETLALSWQRRLGMPLTSWYGSELVDGRLAEEAARRTAGSSFSDTPAGICWVLHDFDVTKIDGSFLREWTETGEPRIIFNYRDPRDTLLSMVNFLCGRTKEGLSAFNNLRAFSAILLSKESLAEQLSYALADGYFPCQARDFRRLRWLLHHPNVCKVSFEELVGANGGGSQESQLDSIARINSFLGVTDRSAEDMADMLFNRNAFSFFQGQIGSWRQAFTAEHRRIAEDIFGDILPAYGYE